MNEKQKIKKWIGNNQETAIGLLKDLLKIPSVNPYFEDDENLKREGNAQRFLKDYLEELGFEAELSYPDAQELKAYEGKAGYCKDHTFEDRPNLYGVMKGCGNGRSIMLSGHMDVVQTGSKWTHDPFGAEQVGNRIYGRGAVDMKGGIAAMVSAVRAIRESGIQLKGDVKIGTVVDEEAGGMGTLALVARGYRADGCIITEPTHLNLAPLCRGILWGKLIVEGRAGHIELERNDWRSGGAVDAIDKAAYLLEFFKDFNKNWEYTKAHKYLSIPCQIRFAEFHAGEFPTAFANRAELTFDAQYLPQDKDVNGLGGNVKKEIEAFVQAVAQTDPWLRENPPRIEWLLDADCGETQDTEDFFKVAASCLKEDVPKARVEGNCAHTDMGWFCNVGIPTINLGPGDGKLAHQADEYIEAEEYLKCVQLIADMIIDWCGAEQQA